MKSSSRFQSDAFPARMIMYEPTYLTPSHQSLIIYKVINKLDIRIKKYFGEKGSISFSLFSRPVIYAGDNW